MTQKPGGVFAALRLMASWISRTVRRLVSTPYSSLTPLAWQCVSMKPGVTVMRCASMTCVWRVARFRMSVFDPTATNRPCLTAKASARGWVWSLVRTLPFTRIRSGSAVANPDVDGCGVHAASVRPAPDTRSSVNAPASAAPRPRNSPRVYPPTQTALLRVMRPRTPSARLRVKACDRGRHYLLSFRGAQGRVLARGTGEDRM